jgi:NAD(P)-dependent dehydrogenase (short-subunit alcohol dehydrogenase family)
MSNAGGKSIVITGASSGIGRATTLRLARKKWRVFAAVRKESDAQRIREEAGGRLDTILLDVTDPESINRAAQEVAERLAGRGLDGLFNNAGIGIVSPVEYTALDKLREIFEIDLFGQIAVIQAFLPLIRKAKGRIINNGSVGDHITPPFGGPLASAKAAFASMSAALRLEVRPQGIEVCVVEPGSINTPAWRRRWEESRERSPACLQRAPRFMARACGAWPVPSPKTSAREVRLKL